MTETYIFSLMLFNFITGWYRQNDPAISASDKPKNQDYKMRNFPYHIIIDIQV